MAHRWKRASKALDHRKTLKTDWLYVWLGHEAPNVTRVALRCDRYQSNLCFRKPILGLCSCNRKRRKQSYIGRGRNHRQRQRESTMSRILDITAELFSAVSPARLPAFASALRSAIEGSGIWKEAPPPTPITIPWHIVEVNSAAEVEAAKKAGFGKVLIHINKTNPHKSFRLSPIGRHHWKLEFCSYNVKPIAQVADSHGFYSARNALA